LRHHAGDYDVIHIHALFNFVSFVAARAAWRAGVPYVVRPLGVLNRYGLEKRRPLLKSWSLQLIEMPILRKAAAIHYTADAERAEAALAHPDIAVLNSVIIPIPVETPLARGNAAFLTRFPAGKNRTIVLFLSRLDPKKGIELLLSAFAEVRSDFPNALLVVAGSGKKNYVEGLQEKARTLGGSKDVLWPGLMTGEDKRAVLEAATVFVLPSFSENFGIAAAEAMAAGVPSILSHHVAIAPDAAAAQAAVMVPCETREIADALRQLLGNPELRARLSSNARHLIQKRFSPATIGIQLNDLYTRLSKQPRDSNQSE
jgi:glycosyltransferase involved in cell wall biosynthesis